MVAVVGEARRIQMRGKVGTGGTRGKVRNSGVLAVSKLGSPQCTCQVVGHRFTWQGPRPITRTMFQIPALRSKSRIQRPVVVRDRCQPVKSRIQPS